MQIGLPGLGPRLKRARNGAGLTQEAAAELVGVSRMTIHRWEHDLRTISEDRLTSLSEIYGRPVRWFLTVEEGDLDPPNGRSEWARRIYRRIAEAPEKYRILVEQVVNDMLQGLEAMELPDPETNRSSLISSLANTLPGAASFGMDSPQGSSEASPKPQYIFYAYLLRPYLPEKVMSSPHSFEE